MIKIYNRNLHREIKNENITGVYYITDNDKMYIQIKVKNDFFTYLFTRKKYYTYYICESDIYFRKITFYNCKG